MICGCGYLSGVRCRLFAYDPAYATAFPKPHRLLSRLNPDWFYLSCTQVVLEKRPLNGFSSSSSSTKVKSTDLMLHWISCYTCVLCGIKLPFTCCIECSWCYMLMGHWVCRNVHHDNRSRLQNSDNNDWWWESEAADLGYCRPGAI